MDFRNNRALRVISTIVLALFIWTFCGIFEIAYAVSNSSELRVQSPESKTQRPEEKLQKGIDDITQTIEKVKKLQTHEELQNEKERLRTKRNEIETQDIEIKRQFQETEEKIKNLPDEIKQRHRDFIKRYEDNLSELKKNLDDIEKAETKSEIDTASEKIKTHLEKIKPPSRHMPLDPNKLPHRKAEPTKKKPRIKKEEFEKELGQGSWGKGQEKPILLASIGGLQGILSNAATQALAPPTQADLSETIEIQFTQEIKDLATQLQNNPVKIYEWVRNNIEYVPTYGSIQGAGMCLQTKQCNAFDTASLLIALLRASNIPARYVYGTIELPIDKVMNWVGGFTDANSALGFIASGGIPVNGLISGGKLSAAQMEHVWVEAWVDMIPSFGAVHKQGDTWIPLDASFKQYVYNYGVDIQTATSFDGQGFFNQVKSTATINETEGYVTNVNSNYIQTTLTNYQAQLQNYINQNMPNATIGDIIGKKTIITKSLPIFSETLPYKTITKGWKSSEIPDNLRHKVAFNLLDEWGLYTVISVTKALPEIAGEKITVSYAPASSNDESILLSYVNTGANSLPAYLINLKPEFRINGQVVSSGNNIGLGKGQAFNITLTSPASGSNIISNNLTVGTYNAIVFNLGIIVSKQLDESVTRAKATKAKLEANNLSGITKDDIIGEFLYGIGLSYWGTMDLTNRIASEINGVVDIRLPSEGIFTYDLKTSYTFGIPFSATPAGFTTDIDTDQHVVFGKNGDKTKPVSFMTQIGMTASKMEGSIYDLTFNKKYTGRGISTAHIFEYANQQGIPLYTITNNNINSILPILQLSADVKTDIQNAVNSGKIVTVPQNNVTKDGWSGMGYLIYDQNTGAGAYMISGGFAGGGYDCGCFGFDPMTEFLIGIALLILGVAGVNPIALAVIAILISAISFYSLVCQINENKDLTAEQREFLIAFAGLLFFMGIVMAIAGIFLVGVPVLVFSIYLILLSIVVSQIILMLANLISITRSGYIRKRVYVA
jgi:hypothetical protein